MKLVMLTLKRNLIGTVLGRTIVKLRSSWTYFKTPKIAKGTFINDELAQHLMVRLCRPGRTFLDIGSHIGSIIAEVSRLCPQATVIGFEAIPEKSAWLKKKFRNIEIHDYALSDREGEVSFFIDLAESGYSSLANSRESTQEIKVQMRKLDSLIDRDDIDVMKIDVEGAELGVLRGAENVIAKSRPIIVFESGPGEVLGYTKSDMFAWFNERNYGIFPPSRLGNTGGPMDEYAFEFSHEYPRITSNYIAIPMEEFADIRARAKSIA